MRLTFEPSHSADCSYVEGVRCACRCCAVLLMFGYWLQWRESMLNRIPTSEHFRSEFIMEVLTMTNLLLLTRFWSCQSELSSLWAAAGGGSSLRALWSLGAWWRLIRLEEFVQQQHHALLSPSCVRHSCHLYPMLPFNIQMVGLISIIDDTACQTILHHHRRSDLMRPYFPRIYV